MSFSLQSFKNTYHIFFPQLKNRKNWVYLAVTALLVIADIVVTNLLPQCSKFIVDELPKHTITGSLNSLSMLSFSILALGLFITSEKVLHHFQDIFFFPVINHCVRDTTSQILQHLHSIPYQQFQKLSTAEIINAIRRISHSARAFIKILCLLILPTSIKLIIFCSLIVQWGFFGYSLIFAIILSLGILYFGTQWYTSIRSKAWDFSDKVITRTNDSLYNTKLVRLFFESEIKEINGLLNQEAKLWYQTNTRLHYIHIAIGLLLGIAITGILFTAASKVMSSSVSLGDFARLQAQLIAVFVPLKALSVEFRMFAESLIDIQKIINLFQIQSGKQHKVINQNTKPSPSSKRIALSLSNVSFSPCPNIPLFRNLFITIYQGEKVLISGNSGSGKSTLLNLLIGLYTPETGKVIYCEDNRLKLHYISQDLHLFNETIRYNLCYGVLNCTEAALYAALDTVELTTKVMQLEKKLDSPVGDMGHQLSNGEVQRIALARAILLKPDILILDETTHSLETDSERNILLALYQIIPTVIIISHRASTKDLVTRIVNIKKGKLIEHHSQKLDSVEIS